MKAIGLYRESALSGRHILDKEILNLTGEELMKAGFEVKIVSPENFNKEEDVDLIFTMARGREINNILTEKQQQGVLVINSPEKILLSFNRKEIYQKMIELGANMPKTEFFKINEISFANIKNRSVLKPANRHEFWFVVQDEDDFSSAIDQYQAENIDEIIVQEFLDGHNFKYYAIGEDIILSKLIEGKFDKGILEQLKEQVLLTEKATGLKIFGGDFIVFEDRVFCVDANDWPSFGIIDGIPQKDCAIRIANFIVKEYNNFKQGLSMVK